MIELIIFTSKFSTLSKILCGKRQVKNNWIYTCVHRLKYLYFFSARNKTAEASKVDLGVIKKKIPSPQNKCSREERDTKNPNLSLHPIWRQGIFPRSLLGGFPEVPCSVSTWGRLLWTSPCTGWCTDVPCPSSRGALATSSLVPRKTQENLGWGWKPEAKGPPLGPMWQGLPSKDFLPPAGELPGPPQPQVMSLLPALFPQRVQASRKQNPKTQVISNNFYFCPLNKLPEGTRACLQVWTWGKHNTGKAKNKLVS